MSKKIKSIISLLIVTLIFASTFLLSLPAYAAESEGITFTANDLYRPTKEFESAPNTFEAWIKMPTSLSSNRGGVILGNYNQSYRVMNFEIHSSGRPRLYWTDEKGTLFDLIFTDVNVYTGEWTHLTLVRNVAEKRVECYINGVLKQSLPVKNNSGTLDDKGLTQFIPAKGLALGGDVRGGNAQYFKGAIREVAVYSSARTAEEIAADMNSVTKNDDLLAHYVLSKTSAKNDIKDESGNDCDLKYTYNQTWITEKDMVRPFDYAYSFAVVGDTQKMNYQYSDKFHLIYDWILDNIESKKIKFVFGLGDITDKSEAAEWARAKEAIYSLDGKVEYSVVRGNHDNAAMFKQNFPMSKYKDTIGGSFDGSMLNTYRTFSVGDIDYLIFALDYGASNQVLNWVSKTCEAYPDHNVIITTHAYLYRDGTTLDAGDVCPPASSGGQNNGDHMWDKLVSKHQNIVLVISGHDPYDEVVVSQVQGDNGNTVTQMLVDPQTTDVNNGGLGLVALLNFSEDGRNVSVEYYSTVKGKYYQSINQFTFTLDLVNDKEEVSSTEPVTEESKETELDTTSDTTPDTTLETTLETTFESTPESTADNTNSGCGSTIALGTGAIITVVFGMAYAINYKKERRK